MLVDGEKNDARDSFDDSNIERSKNIQSCAYILSEFVSVEEHWF